jgi:hypothetical protein
MYEKKMKQMYKILIVYSQISVKIYIKNRWETAVIE